MLPTELDFTDYDLSKSIPVKLPNGDYKLTTLSAKDATSFQNERANAIKFGPDGSPSSFKNPADLGWKLLIRCMKDSDDKLVTRQFVDNLPSPVLTKLFQAALELNEMRDASGATDAIVKVFSKDDSPVNVEEVREWLQEQDPDDADVRNVWLIFKPSDNEELAAKNS